MDTTLNLGIDAGSTTVKLVAINSDHQVIFKSYGRHLADIHGAINAGLRKLLLSRGDVSVRMAITGSAGMGLAERCHIPFIQEVVSSCAVVSHAFPQVRTLVDIGGEDAKMIFFRGNRPPDIRMNGNCAGGTGSFIDQMATLLAVDVADLNSLSNESRRVYPIASRCGVFSKTDVQNLLSRNVSKADIVASVFHAVSIQVIASLSRGCSVTPDVLLCGGPFTFIPALREAFARVVGLNLSSVVIPEYSDAIPAWGAAIEALGQKETRMLTSAIALFESANRMAAPDSTFRLSPLFKSSDELQQWQETKQTFKLKTIGIGELESNECFIGIDSGSTTTKIVALDRQGRMFFHFYERNSGSSLSTVAKGLNELHVLAQQANRDLTVACSCVSGYGEDLIRNAFGLNHGMVETIAHYMAACHFNPKVSFILDIGGQDMKAIFVDKGIIKRLEINEACSSGCGSFIETFARGLNYAPADFAAVALTSKHPCDLGTRCTVFMNSKVKQSLREGATVADLSAGLSYSVVKNCLTKVLRIKDFSVLGDHIMVQGGTFRNQAIIRALELECGRGVMITDFPELMGAFGSALFARSKAQNGMGLPIQLSVLIRAKDYAEKVTVCNGCENQCSVTRFLFKNGNSYYMGNKCQKVFTSSGKKEIKGKNFYTRKYQTLFSRNEPYKQDAITIGIPRALGTYENYPFWHKLLTGCGFNVVLSDVSTMGMFETGASTVMSDNICFPAKLANGHVMNLLGKRVDRIFLPFVVFETQEDRTGINTYNCPIVTGYSEVIRSSINPLKNHNVPLDAPSISFKDKRLLSKGCWEYVRMASGNSISHKAFKGAFEAALGAQQNFEDELAKGCKDIVNDALADNRLVVLLAGRPYHTDPLIQHKIADIIADLGVDVVTEDVVRGWDYSTKGILSVMQWAYPNRIFRAATWAAQASSQVHFIELTSFGCGPDAFILDEVSDILGRSGKNATFLKIDDINNVGSTRLRIRSLIESIRLNQISSGVLATEPIQLPMFTRRDRHRKLLLPWLGDFYSPFLPPMFRRIGYQAENLPPSDQRSVELGLKYSNNEVCFPATLVVGDFMKAIESGNYDPSRIGLAITQTGGQCRASNYLSLVKRALISAGCTDIPVVSLAIGSGVSNNQPGFRVNWLKAYKAILYSMVYADTIAQMYYASAPREKQLGSVEYIKNEYIKRGVDTIETGNPERLLPLLASAARSFSDAIHIKPVPQIGIVGEIFVKYNTFGQKNVVNWLVSQGVQPVLPALTEFFTEAFASIPARVGSFVDTSALPLSLLRFMDRHIDRTIRKIEAQIESFPYFRPIGNPQLEAREASKILNLNCQFGEGWLIPASFARFAHEGVNNVVSLQPFGCIANHVISKGIEKISREIHPNLNLLFLDFDGGMSEANILNRLHFMVRNAREEAQQGARLEV